ncbi:DUF998 domain-containing protein [Pseudoxanthomonas sp. 10H]|uniref:DUF998 domain-containing protein n=1 Tax=Pseudoxanthomonas sp. 10H TaxID=3242729 RepID=UPI003559318E
MPAPAPRPTAALPGTAAFVLVLLFCAGAIAVQAVRVEYDWWHAPLSFYLSGPDSAWLRAAYYGLALASVLLALGLRRALAPAARYALVPALLVGGGLSLAITATWPGASPGHPVSDAGALVHGLSAIASFLLVGVAMLLQSTSLHRDPHWRRAAAPLLALAVLAFAGLWLHALWKALPRGGSQKAVIALYAAWLGAVAWRLRTAPDPAAGPASRLDETTAPLS